MAESRDEGEALRESIREMVSHCEAMQDGAKALEVGTLCCGACRIYLYVGESLISDSNRNQPLLDRASEHKVRGLHV